MTENGRSTIGSKFDLSRLQNLFVQDNFKAILLPTRVTRLGEILNFGLIFKVPGNFFGEIWFVAGSFMSLEGV